MRVPGSEGIYGFSASVCGGVSPRISLSCCVASGFYICRYSAVLRTCVSCGGFLLGCEGNWNSGVSRGLVSSGERRSLHQGVLICCRREWVIIMFIVRKLSHNSDFEKGPEIIIFFTIIK